MQDAFGYDPKYVMGRSTAETDRLKRHSQLYDASTWQLFKEAGIWEGMKDLDVESGTGAFAKRRLREGQSKPATIRWSWSACNGRGHTRPRPGRSGEETGGGTNWLGLDQTCS